MLTTLSKLLDHLKIKDTKLFQNDTDNEMLKSALAILMTNIIVADGKISQQERSRIINFFANEFSMSEEETYALFDNILEDFDKFDIYIETLQLIIQDNIHTKAELLKHLNNLIICDGCTDSEYAVFENIKGLFK